VNDHLQFYKIVFPKNHVVTLILIFITVTINNHSNIIVKVFCEVMILNVYYIQVNTIHRTTTC